MREHPQGRHRPPQHPGQRHPQALGHEKRGRMTEGFLARDRRRGASQEALGKIGLDGKAVIAGDGLVEHALEFRLHHDDLQLARATV